MEIKLKHVNKRFGKQIIFKDVTLTFSSGKTIGLIGPNGIGKTTLLRMIFNLDSQYEGEIYFDEMINKNINIFSRAYFMQDSNVLYPQLTAYDHLRFLVDVHRLSIEDIESIAKLIGMESYLHKKVEVFSLGMKQHLLIAMALINNPDCIVMDEPFNGLDPTSIYEFKAILKKLKMQGKTIIMSSHNLAIIQELVDVVYLIKDQKIVSKKLNDQDENFNIEFDHEADKHKFVILLKENEIPFQLSDNIIHLKVDIAKIINLLVSNHLFVKKFSYNPLTLEEMYAEFYLQDK